MISPTRAREILDHIVGTERPDFHTLSSSTVIRLVDEADAYAYRAPLNAPGSRGRMFYQLLLRRERQPERR